MAGLLRDGQIGFTVKGGLYFLYFEMILSHIDTMLQQVMGAVNSRQDV
jgi:hypothetical protein